MQPFIPTTDDFDDYPGSSVGSSERYSAVAVSAKGAVKWLSVSFFLLFSGFQAAQGLQSSLNSQLGLVNLAVLYSVFGISLLFAPKIVSALEEKLGGLPWVLTIAGSCYVASILVNLIRPSQEPDITWFPYIASFASLGLGAGLLWTAQAEYLGRCACAAARRPQTHASLAASTADLNSRFFSFFQFAGISGLVLVAVAFKAADSRLSLFLVLAGMSVLGCLMFLGLPNQRQHSLMPPAQYAAAGETLQLSFDSFFIRLLPIIFSNGLMLGFFLGPFLEKAVTESLGPDLVAPVLATFYAVNGVSTRLWGKLIGQRIVSTTAATLVSAVIVVLFGSIFLVALPLASFELNAKGEWVEIAGREKHGWELFQAHFTIFASTVWFAFADSYFESQLPAAVQSKYQSTPRGLAANAAYKLWQTLGTASQFLLALALNFDEQVIVLIATTFLSVCATIAGDSQSQTVEEQELIRPVIEPTEVAVRI